MRGRLAGSIGVAVLGAAALTLAAGCGDDSEQLGADELVSRGDEVCRSGQERFAEIQADDLTNAKQAVDQAEELIDVANGELDELRSMEPPDDLREPYDAYLASRAEAIDQLETGRDAAADRDAAGYTDAQAELAAGAPERRRLARDVGFEVCSQPDS